MWSPLQQDKWHPLLSSVASVQKYRWLKHSVQGVFSQSSLMATIVEFALKEEPLDVEKMRKCLLKQVRRSSRALDLLKSRLDSGAVSLSHSDVTVQFRIHQVRLLETTLAVFPVRLLHLCKNMEQQLGQSVPEAAAGQMLSVVLQLERAEVRLEGIDTMLKLASRNFLLPSVQYAMFCGWQRVIPEGTCIG